jgi:hypothetical protein
VNRQIIKKLFDRPPGLSARQVVLWWEIRRIPYNLIVGVAGLTTGVIAVIAGLLVESQGGEAIFPDPPLFAVIAILLYGVAANVCYTAGWIFELVARKWWPADSVAFGRLSFLFGIIGSIIVTFIPAILIVLGSIVQVFAHHAAAH